MSPMRAILLFARSPRREAAAKRLPAAAPLFRAVVAAWIRAAVRSGAMPVIACDARDREELAAIEPAVAREWIEQRGSRFGERVATATGEAFALGYRAVIVAAIDAPPPASLDVAFAELERGIAVIAPSRDGGINWIGLTSPEPHLLSRFSPRRRDLVALCRRWFSALVVFDAATDLDSPSALSAARHERAWRGYLASETAPATYTPRMLTSRTQRSLPSRAPPVPV